LDPGKTRAQDELEVTHIDATKSHHHIVSVPQKEAMDATMVVGIIEVGQVMMRVRASRISHTEEAIGKGDRTIASRGSIKERGGERRDDVVTKYVLMQAHHQVRMKIVRTEGKKGAEKDAIQAKGHVTGGRPGSVIVEKYSWEGKNADEGPNAPGRNTAMDTGQPPLLSCNA